MSRAVCLVLAASLLAGCYTLRSKSLAGPAKSGRTRVKVEDSGIGVLRLTVPDLEVRDKLAQACSRKSVGGVETTLSVRDFFLIQHWRVRAEGDCEKTH